VIVTEVALFELQVSVALSPALIAVGLTLILTVGGEGGVFAPTELHAVRTANDERRKARRTNLKPSNDFIEPSPRPGLLSLCGC
jgi:hypothetical protein